MEGAGSGDEECAPQKQKTSSRACCVGFTQLFAWRKTCILVACAFLHLSSLKQSLLPRARDKTSEEGTPTIPRESCEQIPSMGCKCTGTEGSENPHLMVRFFLPFVFNQVDM